MFNSMAKYLWGEAESNETEQHVLQESCQSSEDHQILPVEESIQEDDWVLVSNADKENYNTRVQHPSHHQLHHYHSHLNHQQSHHSSHESLSQQSTEVELLDEAASLVHHIADPSGQHSSPDCDNKSLSDPEDNGLDSGRRPSSPESVFSACSGRSSATYRPRGLDSEAWVVAPPPCFTGSQCGTLFPLVSSPLENLLIEHPSMSVYVSQPACLMNSSVSSNHGCQSQGLSSVLHISESSNVLSESHPTEHVETIPAESATGEDRLENSVQTRRSGEAAVHQHYVTQEKLWKLEKSAQLSAIHIAQRAMKNQKCRHQNRVREVKAVPKGRVNHKSKQMRPSGFRSSRNHQRNVQKHHV